MDLKYIPLSYNHADSHASVMRLVLALNPHWESAQGEIEYVRFTDGITNTVCRPCALRIAHQTNKTSS